MPKQLPKGFEALEPFADVWGLDTERKRQLRRLASNKEEMQAFYDAMLPRMEAILEHVDQFPLGKLPKDTATLFYLTLSLAEIAPHVELYGGDPGVPHAFEEVRMIGKHADQTF